MLYIGLGHKKGQGKDTFANFLQRELQNRGVGVVRKSFARPLYDLCHAVYGWAGFQHPDIYQEFPDKKNDKLATGFTVRQTLINVGEHMRQLDPFVWIEHAVAFETAAAVTIITDVRHPNELARLQDEEHILLKVERTDDVNYVSENDIDSRLNSSSAWTATVNNRGSIKDLKVLSWVYALIISEALADDTNLDTLHQKIKEIV